MTRDVGDDGQPVEPDDILLGSECDERERHERMVEHLELYDDHRGARSADAVDSVDRSQRTRAVTPTLTWSAGSGGTPASYAVQVSTSVDLQQHRIQPERSDRRTSVTTGSLSNLTTYYWEVSATNANGTSAWSGVWSFTTIITAPGAPTLSSSVDRSS